MARILVIDDEECIRFSFQRFLTREGHEVICAQQYDEALLYIAGTVFDLVFADIFLGGKTGLDFLRDCGGRTAICPVVMITGYPETGTASEAVRLGAFDYIAKPIEQDALLHITDRALHYKKVVDEKERYRSNLDAIFRSVDDMIVTVDNNLVVTEINQAARKLCGFGGETTGKDIRSLGPGCSRKCLEVLEETINKKRPFKTRHIECRHVEDSSQVVNLSTYPLINRSGVFSGAVMVVRDETRLVQLEERLDRRQRLHNIIGESPGMQKVYSLIEALADLESTVLITGESGIGKELVAESLHHLGARRHRPLIKVNCAALSEYLLESELFGHVRGAFTGAVSDRVGRFQKANGGTLFLDEIGDLSPKMQSSLLRVLQTREFERVGDSTPMRVDVRVIAATNKDLRKMAETGEFRADLLYRLAVVEIAVPPLRDRREDILLLVEHFLENLSKKMKKQIRAISSDVEQLFMRYSWPGNVRELEHALEHASVLCAQSTITFDDLPSQLKDRVQDGLPGPAARHSVEPQQIMQALERTAGNKKRAARLLGIDRKTLYRNIAKHRIAQPEGLRGESSGESLRPGPAGAPWSR